ncbi:hypothetical protein K432DRAFT_421715 [Lepidopterella palustris CBS 459.81]|uniref:BHLH domain-containing protein n=1 Tax=Lepidopterella palustris CBS 459.81 TaxID=1314670 RepID=A0A8E2EKQ0_9PEZI|nr:hypothetical protein K432DRAFT_421715 [Lepidopterella palustris CBS 459.81]
MCVFASSNYNPTDSLALRDSFDTAYLADAYSAQPGDHLDDWTFDGRERPISTVEVPAPPVNTPTVFNQNNFFSSTAPESLIRPLFQGPETHNLWQTATADAYSHAPSFAPMLSFASNPSNSAVTIVSPTPSLLGDCPVSYQFSPEQRTPPPEQRTPSPEANDVLSNRLRVKHASITEAAEINPEPKRILRKRGRPRLQRNDFNASCSSTNPPSPHSSSKVGVSRRLPHNQVERKYREGLNSELERLRRAIPTLPQHDSTEETGRPKPTKVMVLAGAIDYIKSMEDELDSLSNENERLHGLRPGRRRGGAGTKLRNYG